MGVTGQDGSYLAKYLLNKGEQVVGVARRSSTGNLKNIETILDHPRFILETGELTDPLRFHTLLLRHRPEYIYNEADQDHVGYSYDTPSHSYDVTGSAVGKMLEIVSCVDRSIRFFQPLSATMFGAAESPQRETTDFQPQSPYACAKVFAYYLCRYYRDKGLHVSTAILYNHESTRRDEKYLLHKIAASAVRVASGKQKTLSLGDITQVVDIGFAHEYVRYFPRILVDEEPGDWILCSKKHYTIAKLCEAAFEKVGISDWRNYVSVNPDFDYPGKRQMLVGDCSKAANELGFNPQVDALQVVKILVDQYIR
ncbi:GDP-mannose 4,6-dehydratase [bacterium]|nr:GDP-mannose 4,6-dehydratase [bacterium]